MLNMLKYN